MVLITEELVRKRAEHNEKEIFSLEELSLHQCDVEKIDHLDRWCRDLKILYLQSNLIAKIEHVGRLKMLEYLNLALNSIERVENLEGCESLKKLDLTLNFIGEITSLESLSCNEHLEELFLSGNPCCDFDGYRGWVVCCLPQLRSLDGIAVGRSDRISHRQRGEHLRDNMLFQQSMYAQGRAKQKRRKAVDTQDHQEPEEISEGDQEEANKKFWQQPTEYTPESRMEVHQHQEAIRRRDARKQEKDGPDPGQRQYHLQDAAGRYMNVNAPRLAFRLHDDDVAGCLRLELDVYRHLSTSLLDVDVQPWRVVVLVHEKPFQLVLPDEVCPDSSSVKRSQTTGSLLVTMPKFSGPSQRPENLSHSVQTVRPTSQSLNVKSATDPVLLEPDVQSAECDLPQYDDLPDLE